MADRSEKEKKRKRAKDGSSRPSKRVAIEGNKQIKISLLESDEWAPVIGMLKQRLQLPIFCYARTDTY
jgi:DNA-directed RNA polymerase I subunit RPA49